MYHTVNQSFVNDFSWTLEGIELRANTHMSYSKSMARAIVTTHWFCLREESESWLLEFSVLDFFPFFPTGSKKSRCGTNACPKTSKPVDSNNNDGPLSSPESDGLVMNAHGVPNSIRERTDRKIRLFSSIYKTLLRPYR